MPVSMNHVVVRVVVAIVALFAVVSRAGAQDRDPERTGVAAKYETTLASAISALAAGDAVQAEKFAFSLTVLDESRCEGHAALGAALARQGKAADAKRSFEAAKSKSVGGERSLIDLLAAMSPTASVERGTSTWYEVIALQPDAAVVTDAAGRARMVATGLPWKVRDRKTGIVMLLCPPGEFVMGSPENEVGRSNDEAQQRVSITRAFYISEAEVTQAQWERVRGADPSHFQGAENPVESVSWDDCQRFCAATGLRLPSEAEWEYACRAGTTGAYAGDLDAMAWYAANSGGSPHAVEQKRANAWGLYDMHGNVWEWCQDGYATKAAGTQDAAGASSSRVLRGGSWSNVTDSVRSSYRGNNSPGYSSPSIGFRVARAPL